MRQQTHGGAIVDATVARKGASLGRRRARYGEARVWREATVRASAGLIGNHDRPVRTHQVVRAWRWIRRYIGRLPGPFTRNPRAARYVATREDGNPDWL